MKHPTSPTAILVMLFIAAQLIGLGLLALDAEPVVAEDGTVTVEYSEPITGPRPAATGAGAFIYLVIGIGVGTGIILLLAKLRAKLMWKFWYMLAITLTVATALGVFVNAWIAFGIGLAAAGYKAYRPHSLVHNLTEILIHAGIALILVPIFDLFWASMMLIAIAIYDAYAVWKSRHMVKMATFMTDSKLFAGLHVPYNLGKARPTKTKTTKTVKRKSAILGGGDIAFPLLFSGAILQWLIGKGYTISAAFGLTTIVTVTATLGLIGLFIGATKDKFYPAMPFLSAACFVGLGIIALIV